MRSWRSWASMPMSARRCGLLARRMKRSTLVEQARSLELFERFARDLQQLGTDRFGVLAHQRGRADLRGRAREVVRRGLVVEAAEHGVFERHERGTRA